MPEPIYSKRYPKEERSALAKDRMAFGDWGKENWDFTRRQLRRDLIFGKVVEVTNRNECDVDIFEGSGTMLVKIYFDSPRVISELDGMFSMAGTIAISDAKNGRDTVLSIIYDI